MLIAHGRLDRVTSPRASQALSPAATAAGAEATWVEVRGGTHAMLWHYQTWQRLAVGFTLAGLEVER